ncbi:TBCC protein, partial [Amia calva]|nr:TBCC protein [Amia calva]
MEAVVVSGGGGGRDDTDTTARAKVPERLLRRDQARQDDVEKRKEVKESQTVTEEKSDFFTSAFNKEKAAIEELLSSCGEAERGRVAGLLEEISARIQQLQKFLTDSVVFLVQYEVRQAQAALQRLQAALDDRRDELLPKKKFAFRSRTAAPGKSKQPAVAKEEEAPETEVVDGVPPAEQCGFSNVEHQVLIKSGDEIRQTDVLLTHLSHCKVRLLGAPSTLHIKHVRDSEILCGPVSSSVFMDHCSGCTVAVPCQQLRTHNTTDTRVYLHVTSRGIIEDCSGVRVAPFSWSYPGIEADFEVSGLDREKNNWTQVDDFNWLAFDTPSPNWSILPENERKSDWD